MDLFLLDKCGDTSNLILDVIVLLEIHWPQRNLHRPGDNKIDGWLFGRSGDLALFNCEGDRSDKFDTVENPRYIVFTGHPCTVLLHPDDKSRGQNYYSNNNMIWRTSYISYLGQRPGPWPNPRRNIIRHIHRPNWPWCFPVQEQTPRFFFKQSSKMPGEHNITVVWVGG
jgi:hypothetical protein